MWYPPAADEFNWVFGVIEHLIKQINASISNRKIGQFELIKVFWIKIGIVLSNLESLRFHKNIKYREGPIIRQLFAIWAMGRIKRGFFNKFFEKNKFNISV